MTGQLLLGLISGTSVDGIDCALLQQQGNAFELLATRAHPLSDSLTEAVHALCQSGPDEIERLGVTDRLLAQAFAEGALQLLEQANVKPSDVRAIGSHGQTIRHRPVAGGHSPEQAFTLQIGDPNTLAELTGITTVADFRRRDMAAGGEGAPLAPAFHAAAFAQAGEYRVIANIGGISNLSHLDGETLVCGYDCGPGNTLMDHWIARHRNEPFDRDGNWASQFDPDETLLEKLLTHPFLALTPPKSSGREEFHLTWLNQILAQMAPLEVGVVQSTLMSFTVESLAQAMEANASTVDGLYVCGGGAFNGELMNRLERRLPATRVASTQDLGIDPTWVEAACFAWLAGRTLDALPGNAPAVTGAVGERILGGIYPGKNRS